MPSKRTRRSVLRTLGSGAIAATTGCVDSVSDRLDSTTKLGWVGVSNLGASAHRFELRVSRNGDIVHQSSHRLQGDGGSVEGASNSCVWMQTAGSYTIKIRIADGEWISQSVDEGIEGSTECAFVHVVYDGWNQDQFAFFVEPGCERVSQYDGRCRLTNSSTI